MIYLSIWKIIRFGDVDLTSKLNNADLCLVCNKNSSKQSSPQKYPYIKNINQFNMEKNRSDNIMWRNLGSLLCWSPGPCITEEICDLCDHWQHSFISQNALWTRFLFNNVFLSHLLLLMAIIKGANRGCPEINISPTLPFLCQLTEEPGNKKQQNWITRPEC